MPEACPHGTYSNATKKRRLALDVELADRQLKQGLLKRRIARLVHQVDRAVGVRDDCNRSGVADELALGGLGSIVVAQAIDAQACDLGLVDGFRSDPLMPGLISRAETPPPVC